MLPSSIRKVIVQGIPGIGKTCFLYYFLCDLIRQHKIVVFEDFDGFMFLVNSDGVIYEGKRGDAVFKEPLNDRDAYYLFNCGGKPIQLVPLNNARALSIVATTSSEDHTFEFIKAGCGSLFYMPMWQHKELERCRKMCRLNLTAKLVTERFLLWGGVARRCFYIGSENILTEALDKAFANFAADPNTILSGVGGQDSLQISHRLLHYKVSDDFKKYTMIVASDKIADHLCDFNLQAVVDHIAKLHTDKQVIGLRGKLFERFAHRVIPLGKLSDKKTVKKPSDNDKDGGFIYETLPTKFIASIKEIRMAPYNTYLIFSVPNAPSIDAVVKREDGSITGYQMTVSETHDVLRPYLYEIVNMCENFELVWVTPPDIVFRIKQLSPPELNEKVKQSVVTVPLYVPSVLKKVHKC